MPTKRYSKFDLRPLQILLAASIVLTLAFPATRELHILMARLLLRIPTERTIVQGQPRSCETRIVPNVQFRPDYAARLCANASSDPDAYIVAFHACDPWLTSPEPRYWKDHPLASWAAFTQTGRIADKARTLEYDPPQNTQSDDSLTESEITEALTLTTYAQAQHPTNGALWLLEAALNFARGRDNEAVLALQSAAEKPDWYVIDANAYGEFVGLFMRHELPRFDALWHSVGSLGWIYEPRVTVYARRRLDRLLTEAVRRDNACAINELASIRHSVSRGQWRRSSAVNYFLRLPSWDSELAAALAVELGIQIPEYEHTTNEQRDALRDRIYREYFCRHLEPQLAEELLKGDDIYQQQVSERTFPIEDAALMSRGYGVVALAYLALGLGLVLMGIPFCYLPKPFVLDQKNAIPRSARFWIAISAITICTFILIYHGTGPAMIPVGLRAVDPNEILTPHQERVLLAALFAVAWAVLRIISHTDPIALRIYVLLATIMGMAYLAAIVSTAYYRSESLRAILLEFTGGHLQM